MLAPSETPTHDDPGLQPERTDMAWGRTTLSLTVAAAVFLRWMPYHGGFAGIPVATTAVTALTINLTRDRRFHRAIHGINQELFIPHVVAVAAIAASVVVVAGLGIFTVLFIPMGP